MSEHEQFGLELFWQEASKVMERIYQTQMVAIRQTGKLFADCLQKDGVIQACGTGHSRAFAMELAGRAGGLVAVNRIDLEDLALRANWSLERVRSLEIERDLEAGRTILSCYRIEPQDIFIIASNSGVNVAIVEVALHAKQHGHSLVAVTSLEHSRQTESRHPSGKKLYELADIVIDNCGPFGDALLEMPGGRGKACSISSVSGALIGQMITAETIGNLIARGVEPPIFLSANIPGGIEQGQRLRQRYGDRISRL
ncbi:MAG TPA: SIS domain-containing protein [Ktedonobacteraceae bacterium]